MNELYDRNSQSDSDDWRFGVGTILLAIFMVAVPILTLIALFR